jgi:hypothetical protein
MDQLCPNCSTTITVNFCENCGQKRFKRIDRKYLWNELQYTVFHANKGLLYTIKKLIVNPGKTARAFIDGNRVNHYKPILLVFVLSGVSTFISFKVLNFQNMLTAYFEAKKLSSGFTTKYMSFMSSYSTLIMLALIPLFAVTTKLAYRKWGHNFYEHIVMNAYVVSVYTLFNILIVYPLLFIFKNASPVLLFDISQYSILAVPLVLFWFFKEFYAGKDIGSIVGRTFLIVLYTILGYILIILIIGLLAFLSALILGPEAVSFLRQMK